MAEILHFLPALISGLGLTAVLVVVSAVIGTFIGVVLSLAATSPIRPARWLSNIYTNIIRGVPPLVILFFMYFALPLLFPTLTLSAILTGIIGLSVYAAAYMSEIFRGSILAVPRGQTEAGEVLAMGYIVRTRYVILPQAVKIALPSAIGFLISLVKASALASVIGVTELTDEGHIVSTINNLPLTVFLVVAILYFIISYPLALIGRHFERNLI